MLKSTVTGISKSRLQPTDERVTHLSFAFIFCCKIPNFKLSATLFFSSALYLRVFSMRTGRQLVSLIAASTT